MTRRTHCSSRIAALAVAAAAAGTPSTAAAYRQSALDPQGPAAAAIGALWWMMLAGAVAIFVLVMGLLLYGLFARAPRGRVPERVFIVGGGIVFPGIVLTALLVYTVAMGGRIGAAPPSDALVVDVTGHMWWWDVRYADPSGRPALVSANELRIPVGRAVHLRVRSNDVIHSFWVPNLAGKIDMIPGRTNTITIRADAPGVYRGQCAEFCGLQHTRMALHVVAEEPQRWEAWFARRRAAGIATRDPAHEPARALFVDAGCGACHALRGVSDPPAGIAPDRVGAADAACGASRRSTTTSSACLPRSPRSGSSVRPACSALIIRRSSPARQRRSSSRDLQPGLHHARHGDDVPVRRARRWRRSPCC
jgi:cytochrome c oxidase subunit II